LGILIPIALVLFLVVLRFNLILRGIRRLRLYFQLRAPESARKSNPQLASRLYAELLRVLARRGFARRTTQTPMEFVAAVEEAGTEPKIDAHTLAPAVREFTKLYAHARFGGAPCDTTRLRQLLEQVRTALHPH
jgi:hypothetical protein